MIARKRPGKGALLILTGAVALLAAGAWRVVAVPASEKLQRTAEREGALVIYSSTDEAEFAPLLDAFRKKHPGVRLTYESLTAREVYERTRRETDAGQRGADLVISSAMDLQIKLVNDRYAQAYASPHRSVLPAWAVWKNEAYAVTSEPIVIGYNKRLLARTDLPASHDELAALLHSGSARFKGRVGLYDPSASPTGYLYIAQDLHIDRDNWDLIGALGRAQPRLFIATSEMMDKVSSGDLLIAYNIIGSYALQRAERDPDFGVIIPQDYVLTGSRVALIPRLAAHPAAGRVFLDFMLSREGQAVMSRLHMIPLRPDVPAGNANLAGSNVRAVHVGPALMGDLDAVNRNRFLTKWNSSIGITGQPVAMQNDKGRGT
jgi:iron(III) transport system substrate-binding protein